MTDKPTYESYYIPLAPSSVFDPLFLGVYIRDNYNKVSSCSSSGDREGILDHFTILIQKPISAITAVGNAFLLLREYLPVFKSVVEWIPPFAQALAGAGIFLSITQLFLETVGMQRVVSFQTQFIDSPLPESNDLDKLKKWAKHTKQITEKFRNGFERLDTQKEGKDPAIKEAIEDLDRILLQCDNVLNLESSNTGGTIAIHAMLLDIAVQKRNLKLLKKYMEQADGNEVIKEKLYRRLGIQFVKNTSVADLQKHITALDTLILNLSHFVTAQSTGDEWDAGFELSGLPAIPKEKGKISASKQVNEADFEISKVPEIITNARIDLEKTGKTNESMHTQLTKRKIAHMLGSISSLLMIAGLALTMMGLPQFGLPLMILGSGFGMARFLFWITFSESTGWKPEIGKWIEEQIREVKEILSSIAEVVRPNWTHAQTDAASEEELNLEKPFPDLPASA